MSAAGVTVRLEPIARQRSAFWACSKLASRTSGEDGVRNEHLCHTLWATKGLLSCCWCTLGVKYEASIHNIPSGKSCPKLMIVSFNFPLHFGSSHTLPADTMSHYASLESPLTDEQAVLTCEVVMVLPLLSHLVISHILSLAANTLLHIAIAM